MARGGGGCCSSTAVEEMEAEAAGRGGGYGCSSTAAEEMEAEAAGGGSSSSSTAAREMEVAEEEAPEEEEDEDEVVVVVVEIEEEEEEHEVVPQLRFPPGYHFEPKDTELIDDYLRAKVEGRRPPLDVVNEVALLNWQPTNLIETYKAYGRGRWLFFWRMDERSCPSKESEPRRQLRREAAGVAGSWKSTGSLTIIYRPRTNQVIGSKRFLTYETTEGVDNGKWSLHEYSMRQKPKMDEYVLCSIQVKANFKKKNEVGKKEKEKVANGHNKNDNEEEKDGEKKVVINCNKHKGEEEQKPRKKRLSTFQTQKVQEQHTTFDGSSQVHEVQEQGMMMGQHTTFDGSSQTHEVQEHDMMMVSYPYEFQEKQDVMMLPYTCKLQEQERRQQQQQDGFDMMSYPSIYEPHTQKEQVQDMTMLPYSYTSQELEGQNQQQLGFDGGSHQNLHGDQHLPFATYDTQLYEEQQNGRVCVELGLPNDISLETRPFDLAPSTREEMPNVDLSTCEEMPNVDLSPCDEMPNVNLPTCDEMPDVDLSMWEIPDIDMSLWEEALSTWEDALNISPIDNTGKACASHGISIYQQESSKTVLNSSIAMKNT